MVEANPLLASQHAKILDLELQLKHTTVRSQISVLCNDLISRLEKVLRSHETHKSEIALLELELQNSSQDQQMDCEMLDEFAHKPQNDKVSFFEAELLKMQLRINRLEGKNKEYLELFCGTQNTTSTNEGSMPQILDLMKGGDGIVHETS